MLLLQLYSLPTVCDCSGRRYGYFSVCWSSSLSDLEDQWGNSAWRSHLKIKDILLLSREYQIWASGSLTVLTTSAENNGTTVQCVLLTIPPNLPVSSDNATQCYQLVTCGNTTKAEIEYFCTVHLCNMYMHHSVNNSQYTSAAWCIIKHIYMF